MGKALRLAAVMCATLLFAATWSGDVAADVEADESPTTSINEPVTEPSVALEVAANQGAVGPSAVPAGKDPLAPYGIGPAAEAVPYEALSQEQQSVADRGRDTTGWAATNNAFGAAVVEQSKEARAEAAQHQLGIDDLDTVGVVE